MLQTQTELLTNALVIQLDFHSKSNWQKKQLTEKAN